MKELINRISTTSVIAVLIILLSFFVLIVITLMNVPHDNTRATQIITGVFGVLMLTAGYYFGASKRDKPTPGTANVEVNATATTPQ